MTLRFFGLTFVCLVAMSSIALGAVVEVDGAPVTEATVYLRAVELVRELSVQVPQGSSTVEILDFPDGIEAEAVRVTVVGGTASVASFAIDTRTSEPEEETAEIDARIAELEDRLFVIEGQGTDEATLRKWIESAAATRLRPGTEDLPAERLDPRSIMEVYELLNARFDDLLSERLARRQEKRALEAELAESRDEREERIRPETRRVAQVAIQTSRATRISIRLTHFVEQAAWVPRYLAALRGGEIELVANAAVRQWTAEDWPQARLRLTTVKPSKRLSAPRLSTWRLAIVEPTPASGTTIDHLELNAIPTARDLTTQTPGVLSDRINVGGKESGQQAVFIAPGTSSGDDAPGGRGPSSLATVRTRYSVTFEVPERSAIPGEGQPRQLELWRERLPATVTYRTKPELETTAYLEALIRSPANVPLLPGPMKLYIGDALIGERTQGDLAPGSELILSLGADHRLEISRKVVNRSREALGRRDRETWASYAYQTRITNNQDEPIRIALEDRMPVIDDERVRIEWATETTPGHQPSKTRKGVVIWKLDIAPGETFEVDFGFTVTYPSDVIVKGLPPAPVSIR